MAITTSDVNRYIKDKYGNITEARRQTGIRSAARIRAQAARELSQQRGLTGRQAQQAENVAQSYERRATQKAQEARAQAARTAAEIQTRKQEVQVRPTQIREVQQTTTQPFVSQPYTYSQYQQDTYKTQFSPISSGFAATPTQETGFEYRTRRQAEREAKIQEVQSTIFSKIGLAPKERTGFIGGTVETGKAVVRQVASIPTGTIIFGGRLAVIGESLVAKPKESLQAGAKAVKETPSTLARTYDIRTAEGRASVITTAAFAALTYKSIKTAQTKPITTQKSTTARFETTKGVFDRTKIEGVTTIGKKNVQFEGRFYQTAREVGGITKTRGVGVVQTTKGAQFRIQQKGLAAKGRSITVSEVTKGKTTQVVQEAARTKGSLSVSYAGETVKGKPFQATTGGVAVSKPVLSKPIVTESGAQIGKTTIITGGKVQLPVKDVTAATSKFGAIKTGIRPKDPSVTTGGTLLKTQTAPDIVTAQIGKQFKATLVQQQATKAATLGATTIKQPKYKQPKPLAPSDTGAVVKTQAVYDRPQPFKEKAADKFPKYYRELDKIKKVTKRIPIQDKKPSTTQLPRISTGTGQRPRQPQIPSQPQRPIQTPRQTPIFRASQTTRAPPITRAAYLPPSYKAPLTRRTLLSPIGFLPKGAATRPFKTSALKVSQPKAYTPSAFAAGFGIKGTPTAVGVATGFGLRPIKKKKKKKGELF